ncbi:MAG: GNAT family N-acetyltransferase [Lacrimispora sp.]|uniref:GNAT family N-acetyltransferase n=1 Tax=Lacrimispora sp. TaxID=2719234 RepID=UPI0039E42EA8
MQELVIRKATDLDMGDIMKLQVNVFSGEQKIPENMIEVIGEEAVQWWCATIESSIVGAVAAWKEDEKIHWGRFAVNSSYRGKHIGTALAKYSLEDLFSQGIKEVYMEAREATVKIICDMGGKIVGKPVSFYEGTITPVLICEEDYYK